MNSEKDELCGMSRQQLNPFLAQPADFVINEDTETPAHGQCGSNKRQYAKLLREAASVKGKSKFHGKQDRPTEASDAKSPRTK